MKRLEVSNFGPIRESGIDFGDLTLFVGPQATGKSLCLELIKLLLDTGSIHDGMLRHGIRWGRERDFLELYFGEGMHTLNRDDTEIVRDGEPVGLGRYLRRYGMRRTDTQVFYTPAQRVLALRDGLTRPFTDYRFGDPYVVRDFSDKLHQLLQTEFAGAARLFPQTGRLKASYRDLIEQHVFGRFQLQTDLQQFPPRIVLRDADETTLPFLAWSSGQREFVPLLLGLYWLIPAGKFSRRDGLKWAVIEEPEMGLHPTATSVVVLLMLELLHRGYKVCVSTHSPHVLDIIWALQVLASYGGTSKDVRRIFGLPSRPNENAMAKDCLRKLYRVYYFQPSGHVTDITNLDPGAEDVGEAGWGGLTEFSGRIGEIVSEVVARREATE